MIYTPLGRIVIKKNNKMKKMKNEEPDTRDGS